MRTLTRIVSFLPKEDWIVVGWVVAIKLLLFAFGATSYAVLWDKYIARPHQWFEIWDQWDFGYYQKIAELGYSGTDGSTAFYPLFPWLVRLVAHFSKDYLAAGLIVSGIASAIAAILLRRLVQLDYPGSVAMRSVWFFLIFPTAYFLHVGYSEGLFLALALACILAARVERWWSAGVLGAFCWMTRAAGVVLVPTLAVEATQQYWGRRKSCSYGAVWPRGSNQVANASAQRGGYSASGRSPRNWQWLWIAIVPTGFVVYLLVNWSVSGDPFAFVQTRKLSFEQSFASPLAGIRQAIWVHYPTSREAEMVGTQELFFVALGFVCTIISWIKLRPVYAMWMTGSWILSASVSFFRSMPRYTLTMFPIFILFALLGRNRFWAGVLTVWSLLLFALFAVLFARGEWAF
jgi:Mannosyltransferase (PIG-V)